MTPALKSYKILLLIICLTAVVFIAMKNVSQPAYIKHTLGADPACPLQSQGDADCNQKIDLVDFEIWRKGYFVQNGISPTAGLTPTSTPLGSCIPPYTASSPWNTKIEANPQYDPQNSAYIGTLTPPLGSDPTQYTYPVYEVTSATPVRSITLSGQYSNVTNNGTSLTRQSAVTVQIPIPDGAQQAAGTDANIVFWNRSTGDEWGFWQTSINTGGTSTAVNGYHYNTNWSGVPPRDATGNPFGSRGAGVPYLAGLIRPCEINQGHIDHAIAFAYNTPSSSYVYPASKSDGTGSFPYMPEGARLQLDPAMTDSQLQARGCTGTCLIIAHALQQYGMFIIDKSGHPKIYPEYEGTAQWNGLLTAGTVTETKIPFSALKVLKLP